MYSRSDLATDLENISTRGFDVARVSEAACKSQLEHGLEVTASMDHVLLMLVAMKEGEEFALTESEFLALI